MIDHQPYRFGAVDEALPRRLVETKSYVLHRAQLVFLAATRFEFARNLDVPEFEAYRRLDPLELDQALSDVFLVGHLDEHGAAQFAGLRNELVVAVYFFSQLVDVGDVLGAHHLLDLEQYRVPILEDEGDEVAYADAATALKELAHG